MGDILTIRRGILLDTPHTDTVSGDIATFSTDMAGKLPRLAVSIPVTQLGSGDPSFSNVRPIQAFPSVTVRACGHNIFNEATATIFRRYFDSSDMWTYSSSSGSWAMRCRPNTTYTVSAGNSSLTIFRVGYLKETSLSGLGSDDKLQLYGVQRLTGPGHITIEAGDNAHWLVIQCNMGRVDARDCGVMVEIGSTASQYQAYLGSNYATVMDFGRDVYRGTVNLVTGAMTIYGHAVILDGTEDWTLNGSGTSIYYRTKITGKKCITSNRHCSHLPNASISTSTTSVGYYANTPSGETFIYLSLRPPNVSTDYNTKAKWTTFLAEQYAAGTPVTCYYVYDSAYYETLYVDPTQIVTQRGENNIFATTPYTGDTSVRYYKH